MKGIIYSRVSTEGQEYERQTNDLLEYAKRNNIELISEPLEEKESGFNDDRPKFKELQKLTKDDVDIILVWELTRLSRRSIFLQQTVQDFIDKGIRIYAYKDNFSTHNADGSINEMAKMVLALTATIAESEAKTLKQRTIAGRTHAVVNKGHAYTFRKVYGYDFEDWKFVINEFEAALIRDMFKMCAKGISLQRIQEYIRSKDSSRNWKTSSIAGILRNTSYYGEHSYKGTIIKTPKIIEKKLFEKANKGLEERSNHRSKATEKKEITYLLKSLLVCSNCGRHYTHSNKTYKCVSDVNKDYERCGATTVSAPNLDTVIWDLVSTVFKDAINENSLAEKKQPYLAEIASIRKEIQNYEERIKDIDKESDKHYKLAIALSDNPIMYENALNEIKKLGASRKGVESEITKLEKKIKLIEDKITAIVEGSSYVITDNTEKNEFIHNVIDKIVVYGDRSQKIFKVLFKAEIEYDIIYYKKCFYYFKNDGCIEYTDTHLIKKLPMQNKVTESILISVTSSNNTMFDENVFGNYSFDDFFNILSEYKLLKKVIEVEYNFKKPAK